VDARTRRLLTVAALVVMVAAVLVGSLLTR
jgi:hypothetical protein